MTDPRLSVDGARLAGASARWFDKPSSENPFPDMPGYYVLRRAWAWGWTNSEAVLKAEQSGDWDELERKVS